MGSVTPTYDVLGGLSGGPKLRLDHERFAYAGKFVMTNTGKAVARDGGEIVAAVAFNRDRTEEGVAWLRYLTVREDRQGEGLGPRLAVLTASWLQHTGASRVRIAVNNPYAYVACYRAGFRYTDRETGIAEVVLERSPAGQSETDDDLERQFRSGLDAMLEATDRPEDHLAFVREYRRAGPPGQIDPEELDVSIADLEPNRTAPHD